MSEKVIKQVGDMIYELSPEQSYKCEKHGTYRAIPMRWLIGTKKTIEPPCPLCEQERKEKEDQAERERKQMVDAMFEEKRIKRLKRMNIGKKFWDENFETFKAYTDELQHHLDICVKFAENHEGRMMVMLGNNGNGKNHLAASILKKTGGYMYSVFEIELLLKDSYAGRVREMDIYRRLCNAPLLVINEIGRHKPGDWEFNFISHIINKRYENIMPIILISNKHLKDDCPGCDECLQKYLGNDVISRIIEIGEIMTFTGEDYRYKKREMGAK